MEIKENVENGVKRRPNAANPNSGLTPYDQRKQRNLYLTDALAQKFITRDGLAQLQSRDQVQASNDAIPPTLDQQENQMLQWEDNFARLIEMRGRIGALQAISPPDIARSIDNPQIQPDIVDMLPHTQSAKIDEIDSDDEPDDEKQPDSNNEPQIQPPQPPQQQILPPSPFVRRHLIKNDISGFLRSAKKKLKAIIPKLNSRAHITTNKRQKLAKITNQMKNIGINLKFSKRAVYDYVRAIDTIYNQIKNEREEFIILTIKTYINGVSLVLQNKLIYDISGSGKNSNGKALWNTEIINILKDNKYFAGICMRDEISDLLSKANGKKFGFIYNTDVSGLPGSHWRAIWVDMNDGKHICHYDSFGDAMEPDIKNVLKKYVKNTPEFLKLKENRVCHQRKASNRCGYHCVLFLDRMSHGMSRK